MAVLHDEGCDPWMWKGWTREKPQMDLKFNSVVRQDSWTEKKKRKVKKKKKEITASMLSPKYS